MAGLTVYAVPPVAAATVPVATLSVRIGILVKLIHVLLLGPVAIALSLGRPDDGSRHSSPAQVGPLFVIGFLVLMMLRLASSSLQP